MVVVFFLFLPTPLLSQFPPQPLRLSECFTSRHLSPSSSSLSEVSVTSSSSSSIYISPSSSSLLFDSFSSPLFTSLNCFIIFSSSSLQAVRVSFLTTLSSSTSLLYFSSLSVVKKDRSPSCSLIASLTFPLLFSTIRTSIFTRCLSSTLFFSRAFLKRRSCMASPILAAFKSRLLFDIARFSFSEVLGSHRVWNLLFIVTIEGESSSREKNTFEKASWMSSCPSYLWFACGSSTRT